MIIDSRLLAALLVLLFAAPIPVSSTSTEPADQKRTPPKTAPAPAPQPRKPPAATPPRAVPRSPASRPPARPAPQPPARPRESPTLIYPYYFWDSDFVYRFPYGVYPYAPYPYGPYTYPALPPGCTTATVEGETEPTGTLRLDIPQTQAAVLVDGFYVGTVEDFNGDTDRLLLRPGPHHLELRAPGFQTLTFDVDVHADNTITYRTPMQPTP